MRLRHLLLPVVVTWATGCAHNLELCNIGQYESPLRTEFSHQGTKVFLACDNMDAPSQEFCKQIGSQLAQQGGYAVSQYADSFVGGPDVEVRVSIDTKASGNGSNFLVSWPGFIIFTHAWLGYGYDIDYLVKCIVSHTASGNQIAQFEEPMHLHMRHAEFDRTWAAGCGWLFLYTAPAFVNGFYVITYDEDITPQLYNTAYPVLAGSIARRLVDSINASSLVAVKSGHSVQSAIDKPIISSVSYSVELFERNRNDGFAYDFKLCLKDGADAGISALQHIKHEMRQAVASDYIAAYGGNPSEVKVDFSKFSMKDSVIEGRAEVMRIAVLSLRYDAVSQKGVIAVKIGANSFDEARKWVRKNIETLARDKNIALTTGQLPAEARFYLGAERVKEGDVLEIEFETE